MGTSLLGVSTLHYKDGGTDEPYGGGAERRGANGLR